jgi:hypothetical protein
MVSRGAWSCHRLSPFARAGLFALAASSVVSHVGCGNPMGPPGDPNAVAHAGQHITLYYEPGHEPCAGTLAYLDATATALASYLNLPIAAPIPYHYTQNLTACPSEGDLGCAVPYDGVVSCWSRFPTITHELVHAVQLDSTGNDAPSFLLEGEAVALGQIDRADVTDRDATDTALLSTDQLDATDYGLAGDFVSYLLARFGPAPFERTLAALRPNAAVDEIEGTFARQYGGETMANLRADRAASPVSFYWNRLDLSECMAGTPDARLGRPGTISETVDCGSNAYGAPTLQSSRDIAFDIAAEGLYLLEVTPPKGGALKLETCGGGRALEISNALEANAVVVGYLHPGRYAFILTALTPSEPTTFTLGVEPLALATPPACESVPPVPVPAGTKNIYLFSMDDRAIEVPFVMGAPAAPIVAAINPLSSVVLCRGGCGVDCQPATPLATLPTVSAGTTFSVRATLVGQPDLVGLSLE